MLVVHSVLTNVMQPLLHIGLKSHQTVGNAVGHLSIAIERAGRVGAVAQLLADGMHDFGRHWNDVINVLIGLAAILAIAD